MSIVSEMVKLNERDFLHTFSDAEKVILREDGAPYTAAYDLPGSGHTYTESDTDISADAPDLTEEEALAMIDEATG